MGRCMNPLTINSNQDKTRASSYLTSIRRKQGKTSPLSLFPFWIRISSLTFVGFNQLVYDECIVEMSSLLSLFKIPDFSLVFIQIDIVGSAIPAALLSRSRVSLLLCFSLGSSDLIFIFFFYFCSTVQLLSRF